MSKPHWSWLKHFFKQMNTVNPLRLTIRWSYAPLLEILLCSHCMEKPEHVTRWDPGLTWVIDSWGWWTPGFTHDSYASHAVCTLKSTEILWCTPTSFGYPHALGNSVFKSLVMWVFPLFQVSVTGISWYPTGILTSLVFEGTIFRSVRYPGYPLEQYRDTNIPCYLGCCFEVLSFAAYPGYPLVPYRDTNIPCYLSWCFEGTIFRSVTWVASVIRANTVPTPIIPATQATHSSLYLGQEFRQIKGPLVIA